MQWIQSFFVSILTLFGVQTAADMPAEATLDMNEVVEVDDTSNEAELTQMDTNENSMNETDTTAAQNEDAETTATPNTEPATAQSANIQTALVAGGCFWCVESDLEKTYGVISAVSGYAGGSTENPTYENYGSGGHREVVEVTYDANKISYEGVLIVTMKTTDPTDDSGTFADRGDKYSAAFYYENDTEKVIIDTLITEVNENGPYDAPLAIDVEARPRFWPAEDYHQDYYKGTLSQLKYKYYRNASGRDDFISRYWSDPHSPTLPWRNAAAVNTTTGTTAGANWQQYQKPSAEVLEEQLDSLTYKVTQEEGTERAGTSPLDKNYESGIYVDVLSGEPLFSSRDKYDSGTGWPSFTKPITATAVTEHEDRKLFSVRTEIRSAIADNHLGHVFTDGPEDTGGLRYCMNGVALRFVPEAEMEAAGYGAYRSSL